MGRIERAISELRRRRVFRALAGWGIAAFAILQVSEPLIHAADLPGWTLKVVVACLGLGFPITALLAWAYDLTAKGLVRAEPALEAAHGAPGYGVLKGAALLVALGTIAAAPGVIYYFVLAPGSTEGFAARPAVARTPSIPSIAVLPFTDMSPGRDEEYFADGVSEEILNALATVEDLRVIGRTSSFSFKGKSTTLAAIGRELHAGVLLQGSVRKEGDRLRVAVQLVRASDEVQVWSQTFDRELQGTLALQGEIARAVVDALKVRLAPGSPVARKDERGLDPIAYDQYLLGRAYFRRGPSERNVRLAAEAFRRAWAQDPSLARAWAGYAQAMLFVADNEPDEASVAEARRIALSSAERAIALNPDLVEAYLARSSVRRLGFLDLAGAQADVDKAASLSPGLATVVVARGAALLSTGRAQQAVEVLAQGIELDPLLTWPMGALAAAYVELGDAPSARATIARAREVSPDAPFSAWTLGIVSLLEADPSQALEEFRRSPDAVWRLAGEAMALHSLGRREDSDRALGALAGRFAHSGAYQVATVHAWRGEADAAFEWLERAYRQRDGGLVDLKVDPVFRPLRGDPRFASLLRRMNLPID